MGAGVLAIAEDLKRDYADYSQVVGKPHRPTKRRMYDFIRIAILSVQVDIDPRFYLWSMFEASKWRVLVGYRALVSEESFAKMQNLEWMLLPKWADQNIKEADVVDVNLSTTPYGEQVKALHGRGVECLPHIRETGGFHPGSNHCGRCNVAFQCRENLRLLMGGFDLAEVRSYPRQKAVEVMRMTFEAYPTTPLTKSMTGRL